MKTTNYMPVDKIHTEFMYKITTLILLFFLPLKQSMAQEIKISPFISTGSSVTYTEAEPNIWFILDDSGSMTQLFNGGYMPYDPNVTYVLPKNFDGQDMPINKTVARTERKRIKTGTKTKKVRGKCKVSKVRRVCDFYGCYQTSVCTEWNYKNVEEPTYGYVNFKYYNYYVSPFTDAANNRSERNWSRRQEEDTINFRDNGSIENTTCSSVPPENLDNCLIWKNYYSERIRTLKSAMSVSLFSEENKTKFSRMRIGYSGLKNQNNSTFPVKPLYDISYQENVSGNLVDREIDGDANKQTFKRWLWGRDTRARTPSRGVTSKLIGDVVEYSHVSTNTTTKETCPRVTNPAYQREVDRIIEDYKQDYRDNYSTYESCTKGEPNCECFKDYFGDYCERELIANPTEEQIKINTARDIANIEIKPKIKKDENCVDEKIVEKNVHINNPFVKIPNQPYHNEHNPVVSCRRNYQVLLTDGGWYRTPNNVVTRNLGNKITDKKTTEQKTTFPDKTKYTKLSPYKKNFRDPDNAKWAPDRTLADIAFIGWKTDIDGNDKNNNMEPKNEKINGVVQEHAGDTYWHPYNDPATWQHVNTFTIGFGLPGDADVNPPVDGRGGINPAYLHKNFAWTITKKAWPSYSITDDTTLNDLANAAVASRGRFYNVKTSDQMIMAFDDILQNANKGGSTSGVKGSSGVIGTGQFNNNAHYSTLYNIEAYTGQLFRKQFYDGKQSSKASCFKTTVEQATAEYGQVCSKPKWDASEELNDTSNTRTFISLKRKNDSDELTNDNYKDGIDPSKLKYEQIDFTVANLNEPMKNRLIAGFPKALQDNFNTNDNRLNKLISYIKGEKTEEDNNIFRKRQQKTKTGTTVRNLLGVIMRSSPVFTGLPEISSLHPLRKSEFPKFFNRYAYKEKVTTASNGEKSTSYESLCTTASGCSDPVTKKFVEMVYVGANDGMLHAFRADTGKEVFAYLPNTIYNNLAKVVDAEEQPVLVDGNISIKSINVKKATSTAYDWKKLLVGGMGGGGKGLYALDVSDVENPSNKADGKAIARWEYSDYESKLYQLSKSAGFATQTNAQKKAAFKALKSNIGNIMGKPSIMQLNDGTWAVIVGNGYNSESNKAALIVINANTGEPIQELVLDNSYTAGIGPNGLGPVSFVSYPKKTSATANRVDRGYAGDLRGNLWVFDLSNASKTGGITVAKRTGSTQEKPLFTAQHIKSVGRNRIITKQPITVKPMVRKHPTNYGNIIHFGTGSLFAENDLSSNITNSIYAVWDDWIPTVHGGLTTPRTGNTINKAQLREVKFRNINGEEVTVGGKTQKVRILKEPSSRVNQPVQWAFKNSELGTKQRGWYVDLQPRERAWQKATISYGGANTESISYNTALYENKANSSTGQSSCSQQSTGVTNWRLAFNPEDGTQYIKNSGTIDLTEDGTTTQQDLITIEYTINGTVIRKKVPVSGLSTEGQIGLNSSPTTTNSDLDPIKPNGNLCSYKTEIIETTGGQVTQKRVCRVSAVGSWTELR